MNSRFYQQKPGKKGGKDRKAFSGFGAQDRIWSKGSAMIWLHRCRNASQAG
jgi:hypothetical protein